jgi:predicted AlkP superfamily phosphohydrolase/phosphomutase
MPITLRMHAHPKVLVVGLDSADYDLMKGFLEEGSLPNLNEIAKQGVFSKLVSTVPDMTPPAWTSIVTGTNPGKHNIFGFFQPSGGKVRLTNSKNRKRPSIWELMPSECSKVVINVPLTHPVKPMKGCMVSDNLTTSTSSEWVYPESEKVFLLSRGYQKCVTPKESGEETMEALLQSVEVRSNVFLDLLRRYDWCFGMVVFSETDWVQHAHPQRKDRILSIYKKIDESLGDLAGQIKSETLTIVLSDHGFRVSSRKLFVNNWLARIGLLELGKSTNSSLISKLTNNSIVPNFYPFVRILPNKLRERIQHKIFRPSDDLAAISGLYQIGWDMGEFLRLYITDDERSRYDYYYEHLLAESQKLSHPKDSSKRPIKQIYRKSQLYHGIYSIYAPDFVIELDGEFSGADNLFGKQNLFLNFIAGAHRKEGILISSWSNPSRKGRVIESSVSVYDVAPTILNIFSKKVPDSDGHVISEIADELPRSSVS